MQSCVTMAEPWLLGRLLLPLMSAILSDKWQVCRHMLGGLVSLHGYNLLQEGLSDSCEQNLIWTSLLTTHRYFIVAYSHTLAVA